MTSVLSSLSSLISSNVRKVEAAYSNKGTTFPSLDAPYQPGPLDDDAEVMEATRIIVAAATQLLAAVRPPADSLFDHASGMHMAASLGLAVDVDLADVLKEAGPDGLHVNDIGSAVSVEPSKLSRVLRHLATRHVFKEVSPEVFANNRLSSAIAKPKPFSELKADKLSKYDEMPGAALIGQLADESLKSAAYLSDFLQDSHGYTTAMGLAFKSDATLWQWYGQPENEHRHRRFYASLKGVMTKFPPPLFIDGYHWAALAKDSVVVDVGGNVGAVTRVLESEFTHLRYIVQDLPNVIADASKFWEKESPQALADGRVVLQEQNFFEPQQVKGAAAYILRWILHDWPNPQCIEILTQLRRAAEPHSRLIVFESIMQHACVEPDGPPLPPAPLLPNLGVAVGGTSTVMDLQMMAMASGQERTRQQFVDLGLKAGWKLESLKPGPLAAMIFAPIE
ncbi:S-adenosyl-L-methionine-dependent methyltransferase [Gloeopeniophorella convolvens]|nr:S-adenosyl-L-methionine-dependent methyltransferase [Gloeopeniophorella convolvens]